MAFFQFNGSIQALAVERFHTTEAYGKVGLLTGMNLAMQCEDVLRNDN